MKKEKLKFSAHILKIIDEDQELKERWDALPTKSQRLFRDIDAGKRVPYMLSDTMFKGLFSPELHPGGV